MKLGKKITIFSPKACYMLFELNETFDFNNQKKEIPNIIMYSGPIKIFPTLRELNEHLAQEKATDETIKNIEKKLYKGHIFSAKEFPLETEDKNNVTFVIEKIDNNTCFVEQTVSLDNAARSIEEEINTLLQQGNLNGLETSEIVDYMVFHGKNMSLSYCCYDFDI